MRYGEGLLEDILRRTDLVQLVGKRVKLERRGRIFWGLCPFHKEKSPSFKVENERRTYHCFGCGKGGDAFKWLTETEGLSFPEAVQKLAGEAGVDLPAWSPEDEARESRRKSLYEIISLACTFYEEQLRGRLGGRAREYLKSRGLNDAICRRFHMGYAPDANSALKDHLAAKGVALEDMVEAGLVRPAEEQRPARDFFFDRVMFPIADSRGRIIAFGGRGLSPDAKPKYINTAETILFSKGRQLYNFQSAREAALKGAPLIVAEGYMDVIALAEAGFAGAVAPLGTALTEDQLMLLWKTTPEPILAFDGDEAGRRAAKRASRLALPMLTPGHSLRFVFLPGGEDPDSFLRTQGMAAMQAMLGKARPLADVLWTSESEGKDFSTPERRAGLEAELSALVKNIRDPKIADYYRRDFAERISRAFKQARQAPPAGRGNRVWRRGSYPPPQKARVYSGAEGWLRPEAREHAERAPATVSKETLHVSGGASAARVMKEAELFAILVWSPQLLEFHAEEIAQLHLADPQLDRLRTQLLKLIDSGSGLDRTAVENHLFREGLGDLLARLKGRQSIKLAVKGGEDAGMCEAAWSRTLAQLRGSDFAPVEKP